MTNNEPNNERALGPHLLDDELLHRVASHGVVRRYAAGSVIINEDDPADSMFIILEGSVKTYSMNEAGKEVDFQVHGAGSYVGELCLDGGRRAVSVMTLEPTRCSVLRAEQLDELIERYPAFAKHLIVKLIRMGRHTIEKVKGLALMDVYGRVVQFLVGEAEQIEGRAVVMTRYTQKDIANQIGATREMVSIILRDLIAGGYLAKEDRRYVILRSLPTHW